MAYKRESAASAASVLTFAAASALALSRTRRVAASFFREASSASRSAFASASCASSSAARAFATAAVARSASRVARAASNSSRRAASSAARSARTAAATASFAFASARSRAASFVRAALPGFVVGATVAGGGFSAARVVDGVRYDAVVLGVLREEWHAARRGAGEQREQDATVS